MFIDIHSHLDHCYFKEDLDKVIENAKKANVKVILTAGIDPEKNKKSLEIANRYDIVKACLGIYPIQKNYKEDISINIDNNDKRSIIKNSLDYKIQIKTNNKNKTNISKNKIDIDKETRFIEKNKMGIVAISEIGLDYHWEKNNIKGQKDLFQKMISLAEKLNKPIIVHSRKAEVDCIEMLQSSKLKKIIMHCFTGKKSLVKKIIDNGWFLTAPTSIVRSTQFQENVKLTPITQIFCETDAPYLSPVKDQRNEPAFILEAYKKLAELKNMELKEVVNNIWMNWQNTF